MANRGEVAIVGYAGRLPGAANADAFWSLLRDNRSSVGWITPDRFPTHGFYHPSMEQRGRAYTFAAGLIDDVWGFDAGAFGMSPREAEQVDPQQRHLLEVTHDALAHAGIRPSSLARTHTGVYVGASSVDYGARFVADPSAADVHMMTGNTLSVIANRLSYNLDLHGPSFTVDTACSSSLVALDLAAEAIRSGTVDTALVGGVNLLLSPFSFVGFSRASMLSPTGRCRPFDAAADGYVRAEGVIVLVLRSLAAARRQRNRVHATIVASGVGQDGRTTGLSLPSAESQRSLLQKVYEDFAIDPADLIYVEAHGTGTKVGDPMEADALGKGLAQRRTQPLPIGSVKSNIGHLEPASGLAGVLKSVLAFRHGAIPSTLHQQTPSPDIPFDELNLRVVDRLWRLPTRRGTALIGVNSFGFGGTNAHVVLRSDDAILSMVQARAEEAPPPLLLSAHSPDALQPLARAYLQAWPLDRREAADFIGSAAHLRDWLPHRLLVRGESIEEVRGNTRRFVDSGAASPGILMGQALGHDLPIAFLFSGNGAQWAGMGRSAWHGNACFRDSLREADGHFGRRQTWSLTDMLFSEDLPSRLRHAAFAQPLLLGLQVATVRAFEEAGVTPAACFGHSVGEIAAAWAAGMLSLEQAMDIVIARSRLQEGIRSSGSMAALMLGERDARQLLRTAATQGIEIAAINSWRGVTLSGPSSEIERLVAAATEAKISARRLDLDYPFHSALVDPVRGPLLRELEGLRPLSPRRRFVSSVTGGFAEKHDLGAEHWWRNVREPVRFQAGMDCLIKAGFRVFAEIGPKPILASYVRDALRESDARGAFIETLVEGDERDAADPVDIAVAKIVLTGGRVDTTRYFGPAPVISTSLPLYPWRHTRFKVPSTAEASSVFIAPRHALLGSRLRQDSTEWFGTVDPVLFPWMADHKVEGTPVFPAAAYVEVMLAAAREVHGDGALELRDLDIVRPLVFDGTATFETCLRLARETGVIEFVSRQRSSTSDWVFNARAVVGRSPAASKEATEIGAAPSAIVVPRAKVYEVSARLGFTYGPAFQRVRHAVFPDPKCAVATLEARLDDSFAGHVIDLTALDAAFHTLFASEEAGVSETPLTRMLPIRFGRVRVFVNGATAVRAIARTIRRSDTTLLANMDLLDANGVVVLSAEGVRLTEAPSAVALDPRSLAYKTVLLGLDRPGIRSSAELLQLTDDTQEGSPLAEALLLLEAGSLRATWEACRERLDATLAEDSQSSHLASALLWHLEARGLATERLGQLTPTENCDLPEIGAVVRSLLARHPTMTSEAASLARLGEILGKVLQDDPTARTELTAPQWRNLGLVSAQTAALRRAVADQMRDTLDPGNRLLRLLIIGADNLELAKELSEAFSSLEILLTDIDDDRLDQARASLGDDDARIRCMHWSALDEVPVGSIDVACTVDALSEIAAERDGLSRIRCLLRPRAPLLAGELVPSVFWDIVRGLRPNWWARSANPEFPVGALLTSQEWHEELRAAGFGSIALQPVLGHEVIGTVLRCMASDVAAAAPEIPTVNLRWEGSETERIGRLKTMLAEPDGQSATEIVWSPNVSEIFPLDPIETIEVLAGELAALAHRCRTFPSDSRRLCLLLDLADAGADVLADPTWCAVASAARVAQNEYPDLQIRCVGIASDASLQAVAEELRMPSEEREIAFTRNGRSVVRVERGVADGARDSDRGEMALRLANRSSATRGQLAWIKEARLKPAAGDVEIEVAATGLNFRDVMWNLGLLPEEALEDGYAGPTLGMECAGTVTAVGAGVESLVVGDRVVGFAPSAFASHVVAPAVALSHLPRHLTFDAAATLPVAFLTAYYSLAHLARLGPGETVLIHGGAGAVGLAALQVAKYCGATVIATAGTDEKRALLRSLGAELALNSRTLAFADEVMEHTGGKGVDVVLNSLAGEAMSRSLDCLRPFGRFVELGKRDFFANTHFGLRPFRRNLTYFGVDIDQLLGEHRELMQRLFGEIVQHFIDGNFTPLPHRVFQGEDIADAFRLMQRAGHIGKVVVRPSTNVTAPTAEARVFPVDPDGLHIIVGGTRGFGLTTAEWLADRGARHLALISRSGSLTEQARRKVDALRERGVEVEVAAVDVADAAALDRFVDARRHRPVKGIVHAAMVLNDGLIDGMDHAAIAAVLKPKVAGAANLERIARDLALDYLLYYSSATTLIGNPGQFNYVAANAFLEGLARRGRASGLPVMAVSWGGIEDVGYLAEHIGSNPSLRKRFASSLVAARTALDGLDLMWRHRAVANWAFARIDWSMARRELAVTATPTFGAVVAPTGARQMGDSAAILEKLKAMPVDQAVDALLDIVVEEIARVLRLPPKEVDRHRPLAEIGMDSLMALELRTILEETLQVDLPMMSLASGTTAADIARRIIPLLVGEGRSAPVPGTLAAMAASHMVGEAAASDSESQQEATRKVLERVREIEGPL
jgi:phthiocerol/phenolphthiocerol synthesis type-I polyketide synthase C